MFRNFFLVLTILTVGPASRCQTPDMSEANAVIRSLHLGAIGGIGIADLPYEAGAVIGVLVTRTGKTYNGVWITGVQVDADEQPLYGTPWASKYHSDLAVFGVCYVHRRHIGVRKEFPLFIDAQAGLALGKSTADARLAPFGLRSDFYNRASAGLLFSFGMGTYFSAKKNAFTKLEVRGFTPLITIDPTHVNYRSGGGPYDEIPVGGAFISLTVGASLQDMTTARGTPARKR